MTFNMRIAGAAMALLATSTLVSGKALAWGHTGHVFIARTAILALPDEVPSFVRGMEASRYIGELGPEPDVSKDSGDAGTPGTDIHDFERDPGHYIDLDDSGYDIPATGYPEVAALQLQNLLAPGQGRRDFDTLLRTNTPQGSSFQETQYTGYLPYNMVDQWQQVRKDFAYYRAFTAAIANPATPAPDKQYFEYELKVREKLTLRDIGVWSHFVADGSQPMHVSVHYNGWENFPNPNGYTLQPIHAPFEGYFVKLFIHEPAVASLIGPYVPCNCAGIEPRVRGYLQQTLNSVIPLYDLTKALGGVVGSNYNPWTTTKPTDDQKTFVATRLAAGAQELRDEIVDAWRSSDSIVVGYPVINVADIESGKVIFTRLGFAND